MKKRLAGILLILCIAMTVQPLMALAGSVPEELDNTTQQEWDVLLYTNIERAKAGLPLLVTFDRMQKMAGVRSDELATQFSHTRPDGTQPHTVFSEYGFKIGGQAAENIAKGQKSAKEVVNDWMNSPGHRVNIMNEELRYMGVGHTNSHWVQLFSGSSIVCEKLTYHEEGAYFTLELKNGIKAYAPYHPSSSPKIEGEVSFRYPGTDATPETTTKQELSILAYPSKTVYKIGEGFDTSGFNAVMNMGGIETNANDRFTFYTSKTVELTQGRPFTTTGTKEVEIRYDGKTVDTYTITVTEGKVAAKHPFKDVSSGEYYENAVIWALNNSITSGTSPTTFAPNETCTRGQVVTFLWRAKGSPEPSTTNNPFTDVNSSDYFYKAVLWAVEKGITSGTSETTFGPSDSCTSAQVVTFLWRSNSSPKAAGTSSLAAQYSGQYYTDAVAWADHSGLLVGTAFAPNNPAPRADIVTYLYRNAGSPKNR